MRMLLILFGQCLVRVSANTHFCPDIDCHIQTINSRIHPYSFNPANEQKKESGAMSTAEIKNSIIKSVFIGIFVCLLAVALFITYIFLSPTAFVLSPVISH